ncbi:MAG: helix-turn-helix domain-containing protein [Bacteroidales bacterium]|jgi:chromosomal replication initiation ATPase DnaA
MNKTTALQVSPYLFPLLTIHNPRDFSDPEDIIAFVCDIYEVSRKDLHTEKGMRGVQHLMTIRQITFYMLCRFTSLTLINIGNFFEKDHATVLHAVKCVRNMKETKDKKYYTSITMIELVLNNKCKVYDRTRN